MKYFLFTILAVGLPLSVMASPATQAITRAEYDSVLDKIYKIYEPIVAKEHWQLVFVRNWDDPTTNAEARLSAGNFEIEFDGGLARKNGTTPDSFAAVACQMIGIMVGGQPMKSGPHGLGSAVGQTMYFTTKTCLRKYFEGDDNNAIVREMVIDPMVEHKCAEQFPDDLDASAVCQRSAMAGLVLAIHLRDSTDKRAVLDFATPDTTVVDTTEEWHPKPQCALDTYFQGALGSDRPRCWFKPD